MTPQTITNVLLGLILVSQLGVVYRMGVFKATIDGHDDRIKRLEFVKGGSVHAANN